MFSAVAGLCNILEQLARDTRPSWQSLSPCLTRPSPVTSLPAPAAPRPLFCATPAPPLLSPPQILRAAAHPWPASRPISSTPG